MITSPPYPIHLAHELALEPMECDEPEQVEPEQSDPVHAPSHYQTADGIECIDAIRAALGREGFIAYCRGSVMKYSWRAGKKGGAAEDMGKAAKYAEWAAKA